MNLITKILLVLIFVFSVSAEAGDLSDKEATKLLIIQYLEDMKKTIDSLKLEIQSNTTLSPKQKFELDFALNELMNNKQKLFDIIKSAD